MVGNCRAARARAAGAGPGGGAVASRRSAEERQAARLHAGRLQAVQPAEAGRQLEGLDVDLVQTAAKALGVEVEFVKSAWPTLMKDFIEKCDVARRRHLGDARPPEDGVLLRRPTWSTARRRSRTARTSPEVPDRRRHRQARRHRDREPRRQQRALRARQLQAGEDRHLQRQHDDLRRDPQGQRRRHDLRVGRDDRPAEAASRACAR